MQDNSALGRALAMVRDLRARCPWDRAQTRESLRPYLVEEVLELDQALGEGERDPIRDELSDLLLHLAFQLVIAEELGEFSPDDVADGTRAEDAPAPSASLRPGRRRAVGADQAEGAPGADARRDHANPAAAAQGLPAAGARGVGRLRLARRRGTEREGARGAGGGGGRAPAAANRIARPRRSDRPEHAHATRRATRWWRRSATCCSPSSTWRERPACSRGRRSTAPTGSFGIGSRRSSGWRRRAGSSCTARGWRRWTGCGTR